MLTDTHDAGFALLLVTIRGLEDPLAVPGIPSTAATTAGTCAGSRTAASSASQAPSVNRPATCRATWPASRVLPTPPGPVTVTSRHSPSSATTSRTAPARPGR
jgi:hypothetical protein